MSILRTAATVFSCAILALSLSVSTLADDVQPPPWRGDPLSVEAHWEFDYLSPPADLLNLPPDFFATGPAKTTEVLHPQQPVAAIFDPNNLVYDPSIGGPQDGGWVAGPQDGFIDFSLPNWIDFEPLKVVYVQMTYVDLGGNVPPTVELIEAFDEVEFPGTSFQGYFVSSTPIDATHISEIWEIVPNPDWEIIKLRVPAEVALTEVVFDTISIPEPASLGLLAVGLALSLVSRGVARH